MITTLSFVLLMISILILKRKKDILKEISYLAIACL